MANVYRRGTKSVHRSIEQAGQRFDPQACSLDAGGSWGSSIPPGPRCEVCFGGVSTKRNPGNGKRRNQLAAATTAALLATAVVFASSLDEPVNLLPVASISESPVLVTPGPSLGPPRPSPAPVLTPQPTTPEPTREPAPTFELPTFPPVPTWPPMPTFPPIPTFDVPLPTLKVCLHPGLNKGVNECAWPHN